MNDFWNALWTAIQTHLDPILIASGVAGIVTAILRFIAGRKADIHIVELGLEMLEKLLSSQLGAKGVAIFDALINGLKEVENVGAMTDAEAIEAFIAFVKTVLKTKHITITALEETVLRDAVEWLVRLINTKKAPAKMAMRNLQLSR